MKNEFSAFPLKYVQENTSTYVYYSLFKQASSGHSGVLDRSFREFLVFGYLKKLSRRETKSIKVKEKAGDRMN